MKSEIKKVKLKDILEITSSKRIFMSEYLDGGIPFYRSKEIIEKSKGNSISTELFISEDKFNDIKKKFGVPVAGDILLTSVGTLGIPYLVQEEDEFYFKDGNLTWFRHFSNDIDNKFMLCWLQSKNAKDQFDMITIGSTQKALTISSLKELEIPLPIISLQKKIAHIISTLDDKIELNRKMNQTLEEMAQALFKSWFVDFDPVHAKAKCSSAEELETAAKELGISKEILELFPSEFEDSELGMIPRGWEVKNIANISIVIDCLHSKKPKQLDTDTDKILLQLNNIKDDGLLDTNEKYYISEDDYRKWISRIEIKEGDFVITNVGRVGAVSKIPRGFNAAIGRNITALRPKDNFKCIGFLQTLLTSNYMKSEINKKTDIGTILNALNVKNIPLLRFVHANDKVMSSFECMASSWHNRRELNQFEIQTLQKTRDTLLPKLLSGELDVSEIQL